MLKGFLVSQQVDIVSNRSEIRCLGASETCGVGEGMKRCPSGAAVAIDTTCVNLPLEKLRLNRLNTCQADSSSQDL